MAQDVIRSDGFDEAFLNRSIHTGAPPQARPDFAAPAQPRSLALDVRAHYHHDFGDHDDGGDRTLEVHEIHGAYEGYEGYEDYASYDEPDEQLAGFDPGRETSVLRPGGTAAASVLEEMAPTRTAETEKSYLKRAQSLLRQCAEALLGDRTRECEIEPMQFVAWAIEHRETLSKSSWRQYKAAIRQWLNTIGTSDARQAALLLESKNSSVCLEKTERTSGRRRKSYDHRLFHDFLDRIVVVAPKTPFARYAGILRTWLMLGYLTGLRPHEWCQSAILRIPDGNLGMEGLPQTHGVHGSRHGLLASMHGGPALQEDLGKTKAPSLGGASGFAEASDLVVLPSREFEDVERDAGFLNSRLGGPGYEGKPGRSDDRSLIDGVTGRSDDFREGFREDFEEDWSDGEDDLFEDIAPEDLDADSDEEILAILYGSPVSSIAIPDRGVSDPASFMAGSQAGRRKEFLDDHPEFLLPGRTYLKVKNSKHTNGRAHGMYRHLDVTDFGAKVLAALDAFVCYMSKLTRVRYKSTYDDCRLLLAAVNESFFKEGEKYIQLYSARHFYASNAKKHMAPMDVAAAMGHANDQTAYSFYGNARYGSGGLMARPVSEEAQRVRQVRKLPDFLQPDAPVPSAPGASRDLDDGHSA